MHCYLWTHLARAKFATKPEESLNIFLGASCLKEIVKHDHNSILLANKHLQHEQQLLHAKFATFLIDAFLALDSAKSNYFAELMESDQQSCVIVYFFSIQLPNT
jgi:hypothetical protein